MRLRDISPPLPDTDRHTSLYFAHSHSRSLFLSRNSPPGASERLTRTQESVRVLQKHRSELLAALRKQARLVDVLRRQTMMIEAANTLSFTEREFEDVMDMAAAAGSW